MSSQNDLFQTHWWTKVEKVVVESFWVKAARIHRNQKDVEDATYLIFLFNFDHDLTMDFSAADTGVDYS